MSGSSGLLGVCVVTYRERFDRTAACASLQALPHALRRRLFVVSVANGIEPAQPQDEGSSDTSQDFVEILCADNQGLAGGYNAGLKQVLGTDANAVLFLNADAVIEAWFIEWLLNSLANDPDISGFAPTLVSHGRQVSPFRKHGLPFDFYIIGYLCLRVNSFVRALQFPSEFWLDGIDYWLSAKIHDAGLRIRVDNRQLAHDLSVSDQFRTLPAWRYRNILVSERTFLRLQRRPFRDVCVVYARAWLRCLRYRRLDLAAIVMREFMVATHDR
jgi:GT2 family glycosyltransferase